MDDLIQFNCPACHATLQAESQLAGSFLECHECGGPVLIPDLKVIPSIDSEPLPPRTFCQRNRYLFAGCFVVGGYLLKRLAELLLQEN